MSTTGGSNGFLSGLAAGILAGLAGAATVIYASDLLVPDLLGPGAPGDWTISDSLDWAYRNLGLSLPVFAVVLGLYVRSLARLRRAVGESAAPDVVAHAEHLTDTWTSLFFGVGVIWTAIGMRGALLYALGDPSVSVADGAFAVLQRMVNGGILVALSTTIFGGIGGYLMRVVKTVTAGAALRRYYDAAARASGEEMRATLHRIEDHLAALAVRSGERGNDSSSMDELVRPRRV